MHAWNLSETGWVSAAVFTTLGKLQALGGNMRHPRDRPSLWRERLLPGNEQHFHGSKGGRSFQRPIAILPPGTTRSKCANKIRDPNTKRECIAKVYLRANRWNDLIAILDSVKDPAEASRLAFWLSWVFADE